MAWGYSSSDDSSDDSADLSTVRIKTEPVRCKSEPPSESENDDESDLLRYGHPLNTLNGGWANAPPSRERSPIRRNRCCTSPRRERRANRNERHGTFSQGSHMPSTSSNSATDRRYDIDYYDIDDSITEATATTDGVTIRYPHGLTLIPYSQVPHRVMFTRPSGVTVQLPITEEWIHVPGGIDKNDYIDMKDYIDMNDSIDRKGPTTTIIPFRYLKNGVPRNIRIDSRPPAACTQSVPSAVPIVPPAVPIVPPAVPIVPRAVPPAIPIDNVPIKIKSEIFSDDEDNANSLNMTITNVAADDDDDDDEDDDDDDNNDGHHFDSLDYDEDEDEVPTDDYDDIDPAIIEAQVNLALQNLLKRENGAVI
ncbi:uncharacterized protein LOC114129647 isoform X2 [Aphis gossypii]|uniref:uncharacterized protein LOC114129647 isoform X2 n=1 Tax=Aphis gossypii TaxID=80765 RepID=UPI002158C635|nr:uncharacterized protein LOC114129647 isoform X2 [Aphis gossypii]